MAALSLWSSKVALDVPMHLVQGSAEHLCQPTNCLCSLLQRSPPFPTTHTLHLLLIFTLPPSPPHPHTHTNTTDWRLGGAARGHLPHQHHWTCHTSNLVIINATPHSWPWTCSCSRHQQWCSWQQWQQWQQPWQARLSVSVSRWCRWWWWGVSSSVRLCDDSAVGAAAASVLLFQRQQQQQRGCTATPTTPA